MIEIINHVNAEWVGWLFAVISVILGALWRQSVKRYRAEQKKNDAIAAGVQSLLRENIVYNYNKYQDRGYCPIYAKESIKHVYDAYHDLGGNDVATKLYKTMLDMQEEPAEREE